MHQHPDSCALELHDASKAWNNSTLKLGAWGQAANKPFTNTKAIDDLLESEAAVQTYMLLASTGR